MANILGGVPWLGISQVRLNADLAGNFMRGIQTGVGIRESHRKQSIEEERLALVRQQEQRLAVASAIENRLREQQTQAAVADLEAKIYERDLAVTGMQALPGLLRLSADITDWTDISSLRQYATRNPAVVGTGYWKNIIDMHKVAVENAAELVQAREVTSRAIEVADIRSKAALETAKVRMLEKGLDIVPQGLYRKFSEEIRAVYRDDILNPKTLEEQQAEADMIFERYRSDAATLRGEGTPSLAPTPGVAKEYVPGKGLVPRQ